MAILLQPLAKNKPLSLQATFEDPFALQSND